MPQTGIADQNVLRIIYSGYAPVSELLYKTLSKGENSDYVSRVQARLYALGYLSKTGSLTGGYTDTTAAAVKLFQNAIGITATGTADPATLKALYSLEAKKLPSGAKAADYSSGGSSGGSSTYLNSVPDGLASITNTYSSGMSNAEKLEYAIYLAQGALGCPYVYGATGPEKFDCSGLTCYIFKAIGVKLERTAYNQGYDDTYQKIEGWQNLKRGDIVFFNTISDSDLSDHAGVYLGEGYFIHASSGAHKVVVSNLTTGFYGRVFSWGRRILK
jgi:cell wall-associated NlpC family hydrolase